MGVPTAIDEDRPLCVSDGALACDSPPMIGTTPSHHEANGLAP
jgi:hypothetical protein